MIDPSAAQVMQMASAVLVADSTIKHQRRVIWQLVVCLRSSQRQQTELIELLDELLAGDG